MQEIVMNIMFYLSGKLEEKMMNEWSKVPIEDRPPFREWARSEIIKVLGDHYDN